MDLPQRTNNRRNRTRVVHPLGPLSHGLRGATPAKIAKGQSQRTGSEADVKILRRIQGVSRKRSMALPRFTGRPSSSPIPESRG
jgi:hypothetical protein